MQGNLIVKVYADTVALPVKGANVKITGEGIDMALITDESGKTEEISLSAPDIKYSEEPQNKIRPYSLYDIVVTKQGLNPAIIKGVQVFPTVTSIQEVYLNSANELNEVTIIDIPEHSLYKNNSPRIPESSMKDVESRVMPKVIVPEHIIVHDGLPTNTAARQYFVSFTDYIKNVASSEIYSTWPTETIKANVIAIISFTLNRVFTEWYVAKGYSFTITSSPQYDQKYTHGRTIFNTIANVVDQVFDQYIRLPNVIQPFLAQYSDGITVVRAGWLSQWGSKELGDKGNNYLQILRYYYGNSITVQGAAGVIGLPTSFPGYVMRVGACGGEIQGLQNRLNKIRGSYPAIPIINNPDGRFNEATRAAVEAFQRVFSLTVDGAVGFVTWYRIAYIFIAVSNMTAGIYG